MPDRLNILLIGGGGREHALAERLRASPRLGELFITHPENAGLAALGTPVDAPPDPKQAYRLVQFCEKHRVGLVVIGPEEPLAAGMADKLAGGGRLVFGPTADGARLEADKAWAKTLMRGAAIPTAEARIFTDAEAAAAYVETRTEPPVVKASGLAKGKGVVVPDTIEEAVAAVRAIMVEKVHGDAGRTLVVEERLSGPEVSVLALVDGRTILTLPTCQDYKRLLEGGEGPNTGGMGAFCPSPLVDERLMSRIEREVLIPTVDALRREDIDFRGVLYAGLILTHAGPKVLEFNARFGDPECQVLMARLKSDLIDLLEATCTRRLHEVDAQWEPGASCCVTLASEGYPEKPKTGRVIEGLAEAEALPGVRVYHAGTTRDRAGHVVTSGGRVLSVTATGADLEQARRRAYAACERIRFEGLVVRSDIGAAPQGTRSRESLRQRG